MRAVVQQSAPEELVLFGSLSRTFLEDPAGALTVRGRREDAAGSGLTVIEGFVTNVALGVIVGLVSDEVKAAVKPPARRIAGLARKLRRHRAVAESEVQAVLEREVPVFTARESAEIEQLAQDLVRSSRLSPEKAELCAAALRHVLSGRAVPSGGIDHERPAG